MVPSFGRLPLALVAWILLAPPASDAEVLWRSGDAGYHTYRIPALVRTADGGLVAFCEGRRAGRGDAGDIDLLARRSDDGGRTWGDSFVVWDDGANTCGNPAPVLDRDTGTLWLLMTWNRGDDHESDIIRGTSRDTRRVYVTRSTDGGRTWARPSEITADVKRTNWTWYATGPGAGIQMRRGPHVGRLVIPCDHIEADTKHYYSHVIYSDDHGVTWRLGGRTPAHQVNECQVAELSDGRLMLNMRNYDREQTSRQVSISPDGGQSWGDLRFDEALVEPICQASLRSAGPEDGHSAGVLYFSNPASPSERVNLAVRASEDGGRTWSRHRILHAGPAAYSDLVVLDGGEIGCLYEAGRESPYETLVFERFPSETLIRREQRLRVRLTFGHRSVDPVERSVRWLPGSRELRVSNLVGVGLEPDDRLGETVHLRSGDGDIDGIEAEVTWPEPVSAARRPHSIWQHLLQHGDPGQIERLSDDPGRHPDGAVLTVRTAEDGTRGFSVGLEVLRRHRALWLPELDAFLTLADDPVDLAAHLGSLTGRRTLDRVREEPEATLEGFRRIWVDVGDPTAWNVPWETTWLGSRGHLVVTAAAHGSVYKFAVDRWAGVRPDFASPHRFRFDWIWPDARWTGQRIVEGLPVMVTRFERAGRACEIEQFASPTGPILPARGGEVPSAFYSRARISGAAGPASIGFRLRSESKESRLELQVDGTRGSVVDAAAGTTWLVIEAGTGWKIEPVEVDPASAGMEIAVECSGELAAGEVREIGIVLASPPVAAIDRDRLDPRRFASARQAVTEYWEEWLDRGARFEVPEAAINDLFRANLWHALVLPRHRVGPGGEPEMDLPYSNVAYGQSKADWPINQAVYVDYMLYALRGYGAVAEAELSSLFRTQQQEDGRIAGYANWGVYSPGQLYAVAQHYLLSDDRESFGRLLPASLRTLDWCVARVDSARSGIDASGLVRGPLNDLTHVEREWAFTQAYYVAGLDRFGAALERYGHPRGSEVRERAARMRADVERAFARAAVRSPIVRLADGTWSNFVPGDALTPRRRLEEWYPTDVDCGPLHLIRLRAVDPRGASAGAMLHDHEDNLFLGGWGAANEPVYQPQATAYLHRDEPEAVIRAFYSMTACAFSHGQLSPLEHRWAWGQYFGPPSTDGAWFELYRHMLLRESDDRTLFLAQATPRSWLRDGRRIQVRRAPTYFGPVSYVIEHLAADDEITAGIEFSDSRRPETLIVRLRHPEQLRIRRVEVNEQPWPDFDPMGETVRIRNPTEPRYRIHAKF